MKKTIDVILRNTLVFLMGFMVINVLWQVFSRYILNSPSGFTDELARYLLIWVGILGAAYASSKHMHIAIDLTSGKLSEKNQKTLSRINTIIIVLFVLCVLVIGGSQLVYMTFILGQYSPALQIPLAVVYAVLPISGLIIMYYLWYDYVNAEK